MPRLAFVLLLLGIDWYVDTSCGLSPFTRPMYSTEVVCKSIVYKHDIQQTIDRPEALDADSSASLLQRSASPMSARSEAPVLILPGADPIFAFMSMQC
jgi:hypothetical protein